MRSSCFGCWVRKHLQASKCVLKTEIFRTVPSHLPSPVAGGAAGDGGQVLTMPRVSGVLCRGTRERRALDETLVNAWLSAFGAVAADPGAQVSAETLAGAV